MRTLQGVAFWALVVAVVTFLLRLIPGFPHIGFAPWVALLVAFLASLPALFRWIRWRLLWKLRNRLLVTYGLIGLTPVVLLVILASIAAYVLFGQFANFAATTVIHAEQLALSTSTDALALQFQQEVAAQMGHGVHSAMVHIPPQIPTEADRIARIPGLAVGVFLDGKLQPLNLPPGHALIRVPRPPSWVKHRFSGLILVGNRIFFSAISRQTVGAHSIVVMTGVHLDSKFLGRVVNGLGSMTVWPNIRIHPDPTDGSSQRPRSRIASVRMSNTEAKANDAANEFMDLGPVVENGKLIPGRVTGGVLPKGENIFDVPIMFPSGLDTTVWSTGEPARVFSQVVSRPSLLYRRLFQQSRLLEGWVRIALISTAIAFAILELLAIFLASRLSRTITRSVSNLYRATREVDQGRLEYRIPVSRQDQLAALSRSFNTMSESLVRLLAEQKEKERMQGELEIAQEVQANLFPSCDVQLGGLELHGVCLPARTIGGDYFDFLVSDGALRIAIGDISGKGISAALLMSGLHSAVRAFNQPFAQGALQSTNTGRLPAASKCFQSPANLMGLLNVHLYKSTQPEKYATLFLANYEASTRALTYSNGGQLPPLVLRADGSILRLEAGGTVVGLLANCEYEEATVTLEPGDLLIAYSDGVTEPENEFGDFGEARMVEFISRNRHLPLPEISEGIMQAIKAWIGSAEQPDDITMVLARQN